MLSIKRNLLATGFLLGVAYGLIAYFTFMEAKATPTLSFLVLVPLAMGALPLLFTDVAQIRSYLFILFVPWLSIATVFIVLGALLREGMLCVLILAGPFVLAGLVGTLIACIVRAVLISRAQRRAAAAALMVLPLLTVGFEGPLFERVEEVTITSVTTVPAPADEVFDSLAEFETIREGEYPDGWFTWFGVPRPIRATVDRRAVGGHRVGEFDRGLVFDERITEYDPPRRMSFEIAVDPSTLLPNSTERHAFEAGYFRFVDATYVLEPLAGSRVKLSLSSTYVAKSSVNAYGKLWANAIISDFQDRVLHVIRSRARRRSTESSLEVVSK
jgi:hypothetical protein